MIWCLKTRRINSLDPGARYCTVCTDHHTRLWQAIEAYSPFKLKRSTSIGCRTHSPDLPVSNMVFMWQKWFEQHGYDNKVTRWVKVISLHSLCPGRHSGVKRNKSFVCLYCKSRIRSSGRYPEITAIFDGSKSTWHFPFLKCHKRICSKPPDWRGHLLRVRALLCSTSMMTDICRTCSCEQLRDLCGLDHLFASNGAPTGCDLEKDVDHHLVYYLYIVHYPHWVAGILKVTIKFISNNDFEQSGSRKYFGLDAVISSISGSLFLMNWKAMFREVVFVVFRSITSYHGSIVVCIWRRSDILRSCPSWNGYRQIS